jgi:hypothetical protein
MPVQNAASYNSLTLNIKRGMHAASKAAFLVEPVLHFWNNARILNMFYEWLKTSS